MQSQGRGRCANRHAVLYVQMRRPPSGIGVSNIAMMGSTSTVASRRWRRTPPIAPPLAQTANSLSLQLCRLSDGAVIDLAGTAEHTVSFVVGRPAVLEYHDGGRIVRATYQPREGWLIPAGIPASFTLVGGGAIACLRLSATWLAEAAAAEFNLDADRITVLQRLRLRDAFLWVLVAGLLRRNRSLPVLDRLVQDALALGLACYLIREHSSAAALSRRTGHHGRVLVSDFLDDVVAWELGLSELAQIIGVAAGELMACFSDADAEHLRIHVECARLQLRGAAICGSDALLRQPRGQRGRRLRLLTPDADVVSYFVFGCPAAQCGSTPA